SNFPMESPRATSVRAKTLADNLGHSGVPPHLFCIFTNSGYLRATGPTIFCGVIPCDLKPRWLLAGHAEAAFQSQASTPQRAFVKQPPNQSHAVRDTARG